MHENIKDLIESNLTAIITSPKSNAEFLEAAKVVIELDRAWENYQKKLLLKEKLSQELATKPETD